MNKQFLRHVALATLLSLPVIGGCKPTDNPPASPPIGTNTAPPTPTNAATADGIGKPETTVTEGGHPEVPFAVERPLPENLNPSGPLKEVIKLAQAGVDEEVLIAFVNNANSGFQLGADEIVYLTDIGVPATVINSMMERDKALKAAQAATFAAFVPGPAASTTATQTVATAPTYVEEPAATQSEPLDTTVTDSHFTDALSPYGTWIDIEGYGRCWQPTLVVVNPNWRPYCDGGRWIYTDCGWYWYSDYSWGWAPFHYGRWFSHPRWGWCWYPDYTWGPAWVSWSYTDSYCGWAPLPPAAVYTSAGFTYYGSSCSISFGFGLGYSCYSYVPWRYFCDYRPWRYCAPRPQCKDIYDRATCHNDYGSDRNRRAVNRGLPPERVSSYTRTEIRRVSVREISDARQGTGRREEIARDGRTLEIRRPAARATGTVASTSPTRNTRDRNLTGIATPEQNAPAVPRGNHERSRTAQPTERNSESVGHVAAPARHAEANHAENPSTRPGRTGPNQPLVVIGSGDGRPPTPSTWNPYQHQLSPTHREELVAATPSEVESVQTPPSVPVSSWTPPARPGGGAAQPSSVVRVGRGIEDRSGGQTYRVYSSPQREDQSAPGYGLPPTVSAPTPSRPSYSQPSRSDDDNDSRANHQPARQPTSEAPRPVERPTQNNNAPQRQHETRPSQVETRSAPSRSESSRSESKSESRPAQSDSGRGSRNR